MKKIFSIMMVGCFIALSSFAQNEASMKEQINAIAAKMTSMQCDFVQTKQLKMLNDKMVSKGKMYFQQGNKLRWEYTAPYSYIFIMNDAKVLLRKGQRSDVIDVNQSKIFKEIARVMMNSVVGKCVSDEKDFHTIMTTTSTEWIATMTPQRKDMKRMFKQIVIHFNNKTKMVSSVELKENNGDTTIIELLNVQTNEPVNAEVFAIN